MLKNQGKLFQIIDPIWMFNQISRNNRFKATFAMNSLLKQSSMMHRNYSTQRNKEIRTVIHAIETGVPHYSLSQKECFYKLLPDEILNDATKSNKAKSLFENIKIEKRHMTTGFLTSTLPTLPTMEEKMDVFFKEGGELAVTTARNALIKANVHPNDIENIVFVSSSGIGSPGIDATIIQELGLSPNVNRLNIGFVGCYGGLNGLSVVDEYCLSNPGKSTLLVCLEVHSVSIKSHRTDSKYNFLRSLFADGCVAVVLSGESITGDLSGKWALHGHSSHLIENSKKTVQVIVDEEGFDWQVGTELPNLVKMGIRKFVDDLLVQQRIDQQNEIQLWGVHPGGPAILTAVQSALGLEYENLKESWEVLKNYGNMASVTIWFVLQELMKNENKETQNLLAVAFGPGVTIEGALFKKCI